MVIEVRFFAALRKYTPDEPSGIVSVDVVDGLVVSDLLHELDVDPAEVVGISLNGRTVSHDAILADGDRLGLFPAVVGA